VTTEDDFQSALDKNPGDWQTRLVFADWLQEHEDPRAEGYRILGRLRKVGCNTVSGTSDVPEWRPHTEMCWFVYDPSFRYGWLTHAELHEDWVAEMGFGRCTTKWSRDFDNRRATEDAAARAYARLPAHTRAEIEREANP
jgi:uncharacterized protein (TIGR02996 family)